MMLDGEQQMINEQPLHKLGFWGQASKSMAMYMFKHRKAIERAGKGVKSGILRGKDLGVNLKPAKNIRKWYDPRNIYESPLNELSAMKELGFKKYMKSQSMNFKYTVDPATGAARKKSLLGSVATPFFGAGLAGGIGWGAYDLSQGKTPGQALKTTALWGIAPGAVATYEIGKTIKDMTQDKNKKNKFDYKYSTI